MCTHTCACTSRGTVHRVRLRGLRVRPFSITPPCRQPHPVFGGFYLPFQGMRFVIQEVTMVRDNPHTTRHNNSDGSLGPRPVLLMTMTHALIQYNTIQYNITLLSLSRNYIVAYVAIKKKKKKKSQSTHLLSLATCSLNPKSANRSPPANVVFFGKPSEFIPCLLSLFHFFFHSSSPGA